jgi:hypothetical protein
VPSGIATKLAQLAWTEHNAASGLDHPTTL